MTAHRDPDREPGWHIVYIDTPAGQMSWHISPNDVDLFEHVEFVDSADPRAQWDGHTTAIKYERLAALTQGSAGKPKVKVEFHADGDALGDTMRRILRERRGRR